MLNASSRLPPLPASAHAVLTRRVATSSSAEGKLSMTWGRINKPPASLQPPTPPSFLFTPPLLYILYAERTIEKQWWMKKRKRKAPLFASLINLPNDFPYCESEPPKDDSRSPPALVRSVIAAWLKRRGPGNRLWMRLFTAGVSSQAVRAWG